MCEINPVVFAKSHVPRTRKIFSRNYPSDYRGLFSRSAALCASRFSNRRGRDGALSACFLPSPIRNFSPRAICRRQCTLVPRDSPAGSVVAIRFLYCLSFRSRSSRLPRYRVAIISRLSFFLFSLVLFRPEITYPKNIAPALSRLPLTFGATRRKERYRCNIVCPSYNRVPFSR